MTMEQLKKESPACEAGDSNRNDIPKQSNKPSSTSAANNNNKTASSQTTNESGTATNKTLSVPVSVFMSTKPNKLNKKFAYGADGKLNKYPAGVMLAGKYRKTAVQSLEELDRLFNALGRDQAVAYGVAKKNKADVTTKRKHPKKPQAITRSREFFQYPEGPAVFMIDYDPEAGARPLTPDELYGAIVTAMPELASVRMLWRPSSSSCIYEGDQEIRGITGQRLYFFVDKGAEIPGLGSSLNKRLWLAGHGHILVDRAGRMHERTVADTAVYQPERLDFAAGAVCTPPLERRAVPSRFFFGSSAGEVFNTSTIKPFSQADEMMFAAVTAMAKEKIESKADAARDAWLDKQVDKAVPQTASPDEREKIKQKIAGIFGDERHLPDEFVLHLSRTRTITVKEMRADPKKYDGMTIHDPIEPEYRGWAKNTKVNLQRRKPVLCSWAHGRHTFALGGQPPAASPGAAPVPFGSNIPHNFICDSTGVTNPDGDKIVEQPIYVKAVSRSAEGENWRLHLEWLTADGHLKNRAFPKSALAGSAEAKEIIHALANSGLEICRGCNAKFIEYLAEFKGAPYLISVNQTGWAGDSFVLPNEIIRQPSGEQIILDDGIAASMRDVIQRRGTLADWQTGMKNVSPMVRFLVCAGLSPPFVEKLGAESGGFHFYKDSSQGKTTALQASASVWGVGGDPNKTSKPTMILTWDSTKNALVIRVSSRNSLGVYFDELGTCDPKIFADAIYMLFTGQSKGRGTVDGSLQEELNWQITLFSSGEISAADFIRNAGKNPKAGQMVRLLDIDLAADGMTDLFPDAATADAMKALAISNCGHAGPELLKAVPDLTVGWNSIDADSIGKAATSIAGRARKKFLIVLHAGYVASDACIVPWTREQILEAVSMAYGSWHEELPDLSDGAIGAREIQKLLLRDKSLFQTPDQESTGFIPRNRLGWYRNDMYHFSKDGFAKACNGSNERAVRKELKRLGYLHTNQSGNIASITVDGESVKVTSIKKRFLGHDFR